jgi:hypothetical protein
MTCTCGAVIRRALEPAPVNSSGPAADGPLGHDAGMRAPFILPVDVASSALVSRLDDNVIEHMGIVCDVVPLLPLNVQQIPKLTWEVDLLKTGDVV